MTRLSITAADRSGRTTTVIREHENAYTAWRLVAEKINRQLGVGRWSVICGDLLPADLSAPRPYRDPRAWLCGKAAW